MQHEGQLVVDDDKRLGGIERLRLGFGDHHGDRLADVAHLVGGQQQMRADEDLAAAGRGQLHVVARLRQRVVADGAEAVGGAIGAGEDAEHAGHRQRRRLVDRNDARVRVRRAHHRRVRLTGKTEIVGEAALPGDEPRVFVARHGLADEAKAGLRFVHSNPGHVTSGPRRAAPDIARFRAGAEVT